MKIGNEEKTLKMRKMEILGRNLSHHCRLDEMLEKKKFCDKKFEDLKLGINFKLVFFFVILKMLKYSLSFTNSFTLLFQNQKW